MQYAPSAGLSCRAPIRQVKAVDHKLPDEFVGPFRGPSSAEVPPCCFTGSEEVRVWDDASETVSLSSQSKTTTPQDSPRGRPCVSNQDLSPKSIADAFAKLSEPAYISVGAFWHPGQSAPVADVSSLACQGKFQVPFNHAVGDFLDCMAPSSACPQFLSLPCDVSAHTTRVPKVAFAGVDAGSGMIQPALFAMKILLSCREAGCTIGESGSLIQRIQKHTCTRMHLSGRDDFYPETSLQELNIQGPSSVAVIAALQCTLDAVVHQRGVLSGGEPNVGIGKARLNTVVPSAVAQSLVGGHGISKDLRSLTGLLVKVKSQQFAADEAVVRLSGTTVVVNAAIVMIAEHLSDFAREPWFVAWGTHSRCAAPVPGDTAQALDVVAAADAHYYHKPQDYLGQAQCSQHFQDSKIPPKRATHAARATRAALAA